MSDNDISQPDPNTWEDNFKLLIRTLGMKADQRARSSSDIAFVISNMHAHRILMQYGIDILHRVHHIGLRQDDRNAFFESLSLLLSGGFLCGTLEERDANGQVVSVPEVEEAVEKEKRTGPAPLKRNKIAKAMIEALRQGDNLKDEKQDVLVARFGEGAVRATVMAAFQQALSEFEIENADKALRDSGKL